MRVLAGPDSCKISAEATHVICLYLPFCSHRPRRHKSSSPSDTPSAALHVDHHPERAIDNASTLCTASTTSSLEATFFERSLAAREIATASARSRVFAGQASSPCVPLYAVTADVLLTMLSDWEFSNMLTMRLDAVDGIVDWRLLPLKTLPLHNAALTIAVLA